DLIVTGVQTCALPILTVVVAILVRWLALAALAGLIGGLALEVFVLPVDETDTVSARRRLRVWSLVCIGGLLLTSAAEVVLRARRSGERRGGARWGGVE